jgi:hypothetical protein
MIEKIITEVFPEYEKWDSFLELESYKGQIFQYWRSRFQLKLREEFSSEFNEWNIFFEKDFNFYIYPKGYKENRSIEMWIEFGFQFSFYLRLDHFDRFKCQNLIEQKINEIETAIKQPITIIRTENDPYLFKNGIVYNLPYDVAGNLEKLKYFGDKGLPEAVVEFLRPILTSSIIFQLFQDINTLCLNQSDK